MPQSKPTTRYFHVRIWGNDGPEFEEADEREVMNLIRRGRDILCSLFLVSSLAEA